MTGENTTERKKSFIKLDEPLSFDGTFEGKLTTTLDLAQTINALFKDIFKDYEGCVVTPNHVGQLWVTVYFRDKGNKNVVPLSGILGRNASPNAIIRNFNQRNMSRTYDLSDEVKDALSDFIPMPPKQQINWKQKIQEVMENGVGMSTIYVSVPGLDLSRILKTIYGAHEGDARYEYHVQTVRPLSGNQTFAQNLLVTVQRLNSTDLEKLAHKIGMMPSVGSVPMVRA